MLEGQSSEERMDQTVNDTGAIIIHWKGTACLTHHMKDFPVGLNISMSWVENIYDLVI